MCIHQDQIDSTATYSMLKQRARLVATFLMDSQVFGAPERVCFMEAGLLMWPADFVVVDDSSTPAFLRGNF